MPEHEPQVGQALCSSFFSSSSVILPVCSSPTPLNTEIRSDFCVAGLQVRRQVALGRLLRRRPPPSARR